MPVKGEPTFFSQLVLIVVCLCKWSDSFPVDSRRQPACVFGLTPQKSTSVFLVVSHSRAAPPPAPSEGSGGGGGAWASHGRRRPVPRPRLGCDALRHTCATGIQSCLKRRWAVHGKFVQPSALSFCVSVVLLSAFRFCLRFVCIQCLRLILFQNTVSGK